MPTSPRQQREITNTAFDLVFRCCVFSPYTMLLELLLRSTEWHIISTREIKKKKKNVYPNYYRKTVFQFCFPCKIKNRERISKRRYLYKNTILIEIMWFSII